MFRNSFKRFQAKQREFYNFNSHHSKHDDVFNSEAVLIMILF